MIDIFEILDAARIASENLEKLELKSQLYIKFTSVDGSVYTGMTNCFYDIENFMLDNDKDSVKSSKLLNNFRNKQFDLNPTKLKDNEFRFMYGGFDDIGYFELILYVDTYDHI